MSRRAPGAAVEGWAHDPPADPSATPLRERVRALLAGPRPLPIVQAGDPVLRRVARPYEGELDGALLDDLVAALRDTMRAAPGVGLAAPQVGLDVSLAVLEDQWPVDDETARVRERSPVGFRVLIDPRYEPVGDRRVGFYEGCLSVRGLQAVVQRWHTVRLTATDATGAPVDELVHGWPARIVQHEIDHLAGCLYLDRAETRSLTTAESGATWALDASPERAAHELGFPLPT